jgi:hypothetical protein
VFPIKGSTVEWVCFTYKMVVANVVAVAVLPVAGFENILRLGVLGLTFMGLAK